MQELYSGLIFFPCSDAKSLLETWISLSRKTAYLGFTRNSCSVVSPAVFFSCFGQLCGLQSFLKWNVVFCTGKRGREIVSFWWILPGSSGWMKGFDFIQTHKKRCCVSPRCISKFTNCWKQLKNGALCSQGGLVYKNGSRHRVLFLEDVKYAL